MRHKGAKLQVNFASEFYEAPPNYRFRDVIWRAEIPRGRFSSCARGDRAKPSLERDRAQDISRTARAATWQTARMPRQFFHRGWLASLLLLSPLAIGTGCNTSQRERAAAGSVSAAGPRDPKAPVAKVAGEVITEGDLDGKIKPRLSRLEADHAEKVHELKAETLDELIDERLIDRKAKAEGITPEKLTEREVTGKIPEPPASEVQMVYDQTRASGRQLPPFDQIRPDIVKFLKERSADQTRKTYLDKLRAEAKVEKLLPPLLLAKVEVAAEGPSKGDPKAPITIVEFSDFECPYCVRAEESIKKVLAAYPGKVRLVYRDYPLPNHTRAPKASEAALCAGDQGKYWEMHEKLFANSRALEVGQLKQYAKDLGLTADKFDKCLDSGDKAKLVEASKKAGEEAGVSGTPAFFINGRPLSGAQPFEKFKEIIDHELRGSGS
jgi:protein-disulfide isomerase